MRYNRAGMPMREGRYCLVCHGMHGVEEWWRTGARVNWVQRVALRWESVGWFKVAI